ncbi:alpha/beta fold hydrolase [Streptomyces sp. NPDC101227]|uniref:alpha/beta fold hydrolase n=1 Tax=Streptomyces sp. NPDC101227 TaxID=3366136 RepID=UPI00382B944C
MGGRRGGLGLPPGGISGVRGLCFTGEHAAFVPPALSREVAATIEDCRFTLIRATDHLAHLERGEEYARLIAAYFTDQPLDALDFLTPSKAPSSPHATP